MSEPIEYAYTNTGVFSSHDGTTFAINTTANVTATALGNSIFISSNLILIGNSTVFNTLNSTAWSGSVLLGLPPWLSKSTTYTAVNGDRILADTSGGPFTINLPASPQGGYTVTFADFAGTWSSNNLTIGRNSSNIQSSATNLICDVSNQVFQVVYLNATQGWVLELTNGPLISFASTAQAQAGTDSIHVMTPALTAAYASPLYGMIDNNMVLNGGFEVSQINGSTAATVALSYFMDQWLAYKVGTMVVTAQQVTDAPPGYNNSLKLTVGTAQGSLGAGDFTFIWTEISGSRVAKLAFGTAGAQPVTLGFWTKIHRIGTYSGSIRNAAGTRAYPFNFNQNVADTWEYKTVVVPGDVTGTWLNTGKTSSLDVFFAMAAGTTFTGALNTWASSNLVGVNGTINGVAATSDVFQITGVTLLPGSFTIPQAMAPNLMRSYDVELLLCQLSGFDQNAYDLLNTLTAAPLFGLMHNNIIINGGMEVSQLNGTTGVTVGAGNYQVDQWQVNKTGTMVATAQQVTDAPTGYNNSLKITVGTAESSLSAGDFLICYQQIEGFRTSKLAFGTAGAQSITLGFWSKIHRIGAYSGFFKNIGNNRSYPFTFTQNVADTWEYKTVVIPGDVTGTWLGNTNAAAMYVGFVMACGTTFTGTTNTWAAAQLLGATGTTNGVAATSDVFQVTGVTLLPGALVIPQAMAPNFIRSFDEEMMLCLRYLYIIPTPGTELNLYGYNAATGNLTLDIHHNVPMRLVTPTGTLTGTWTVSNAGQPSVAYSTQFLTRLISVVTALGAASAAPQSTSTLKIDARM